MTNQRASGILLHISSLPSVCGIGDLGKEAYRFVDFLQKAGQTYWQILPTNPTSYGDSPYQALSTFAGARRRMERKGSINGAEVYDDYGHHPDEIRATLAGAKEMGFSRILCAYQPHTYSRTAKLFDGFQAAFGDADRVYFGDIYAAREQNVYGVESSMLAEAIGESAEYCGSHAAVAQALLRDAREGDLVIVMGAGDIYRVFGLMGL